MALEPVNRLPDQTRGIYWLIDSGATFNDLVRGRSTVYDKIEITLPLSRTAMENGEGERFDASGLLPPLNTKRKHWVLVGWCSRQEFDTPTRELGPGQYNVTGSRATYGNTISWYEDGAMQSIRDTEATIKRDAQNRVEQVTRKRAT